MQRIIFVGTKISLSLFFSVFTSPRLSGQILSWVFLSRTKPLFLSSSLRSSLAAHPTSLLHLCIRRVFMPPPSNCPLPNLRYFVGLRSSRSLPFPHPPFEVPPFLSFPWLPLLACVRPHSSRMLLNLHSMILCSRTIEFVIRGRG